MRYRACNLITLLSPQVPSEKPQTFPGKIYTMFLMAKKCADFCWAAMTRPTCFAEITAQTGFPVAKTFVDALEAEAARGR